MTKEGKPVQTAEQIGMRLKALTLRKQLELEGCIHPGLADTLATNCGLELSVDKDGVVSGALELVSRLRDEAPELFHAPRRGGTPPPRQPAPSNFLALLRQGRRIDLDRRAAGAARGFGMGGGIGVRIDAPLRRGSTGRM